MDETEYWIHRNKIPKGRKDVIVSKIGDTLHRFDPIQMEVIRKFFLPVPQSRKHAENMPPLRSLTRSDWKLVFGVIQYFQKTGFQSPEFAEQNLEKSAREMIQALRPIKKLNANIAAENEAFLYYRNGDILYIKI